MFTIFCDSYQEGAWFKALHRALQGAQLVIIPSAQRDKRYYGLEAVLEYDRPDIILKDDERVIFVLERTVEVPSGHNVGQRFGRLVAAAKQRIPVVYLGPYAAYKHGGETAGPRYMNLRLFYALEKLSLAYDTAVTTVNWPVDGQYEVLKTPAKDLRMKQYLALFLAYYSSKGFTGLTEHLAASAFQREQLLEQRRFAQTQIRSPKRYDAPPKSVKLLDAGRFERDWCRLPRSLGAVENVVLYTAGMRYMRADPYVGMAALYYYLYCGEGTVQILHFPYISSAEWFDVGAKTKTYRMYREFGAAILFRDGLVERDDL